MSVEKITNKKQLVNKINTNSNLSVNNIRLIYFEASKHFNHYRGIEQFETSHYLSSIYSLPQGMTLSNAYKVISFISDIVENNGIEQASLQSVTAVEKILNQYSFVKQSNRTSMKGYYHSSGFAKFYPLIKKIDGVVDLITYDTDDNSFAKTDLYDRYFDWYVKGVTAEEIASIYSKINKFKEQNATLETDKII